MSATIEPASDDLGTVDAITFEVIRHRLKGITDEQAARLCTISGSKHVTEMSDYNVGLYLPDGAVAAMGRTILFHSACMASMVRSTIEDCSENPGIDPGDMFVVNDPWKGSMHAPDMAIVAPLFVDGCLVLWAGAMMHMSDIGGQSIGSMVQMATDAYQEGLLIPPTKLVAGGKLREDVFRLILGNSRTAPTMSLDLKGLMAANNAAMDGLEKLVRRYGADTLLSVMSGLIRISESRLRRRLRALPDATVEVAGYMEYEESIGGIPEVHLELRKVGDSLTFDFSKSSEQVRNSTNCTRHGLRAGVSAGLLPSFAYDIPWNEGLYKPLEVICPEGKICNARRPAAVSGNITGAIWEVEQTATVALSLLSACSDATLHEAQAAPCGRPGSLAFFGMNQHGERFSGPTYDILASGAGAYPHHDGVSSQGHHNIERTLISNVEALELDMPLLYLSRTLAMDSGGAGRRRGGSSVEGVYTPHRGEPTVMRINRQQFVPDAPGAFGGYLGAENSSDLTRGSNVESQFAGGHIPRFEDLTGERIPAGKRPVNLGLEPGDVVRANPPAGAGWGDPLDRPLDEIQADLCDRATSSRAATAFYGAVVDDAGQIDIARSNELRDRLRGERKAWPARRTRTASPSGELTRVCPLGDQLEVLKDARGAHWTRCTCGHVLAPTAENWREFAGQAAAQPGEIGLRMNVHESMEVRRYACPGCGRLHAVDLCRKDAPDPHDIRLALA